MTRKKTSPGSARGPALSVDEYLAALDHPHKAGVLALRRVILGIDDAIREEVKWNAPSFLLDDHFATFRLHPRAVFQLILHTGAKARERSAPMVVDDPHGLLEWASPDRAVVAFASADDAAAKADEVARIVKAWVAQR